MGVCAGAGEGVGKAVSVGRANRVGVEGLVAVAGNGVLVAGGVGSPEQATSKNRYMKAVTQGFIFIATEFSLAGAGCQKAR